jgi:hypothetical protein
MTSGMNAFTLFHVVLSLLGIASGFVVVFGMLAGKRRDRCTVVFLTTTVLTSVTGFLFPFHGFMLSYVFGVLSMIVLALAIYARYVRHLAGGWRRTYVISAVIALYLNFFVLIVQAFRKVPALTALAPTQSEPPFIVAQGAALVLFVALGAAAASKFRDDSARAAR